MDLACAQLNRRDCTVSEIRRRLERHGTPADITDVAVATLAGQGLLDDGRYARLFVSDKRRLEQWGSDRIRRALLQRGIAPDEADAALAEAPDDVDGPQNELDRALVVLRRRFPEPPADPRVRERALGFLLRKGYDSELALDALAAHARGD